MRHSWEKRIALLGLLLTLTWPMLLGGAIAGREGLVLGALVYAVFGILFIALVVFSKICGILGS